MYMFLSCLAVAIAALSQHIMQLHQPVLRLYIPSVLDNAKTEVYTFHVLSSLLEHFGSIYFRPFKMCSILSFYG